MVWKAKSCGDLRNISGIWLKLSKEWMKSKQYTKARRAWAINISPSGIVLTNGIPEGTLSKRGSRINYAI